jgi:NYN domain
LPPSILTAAASLLGTVGLTDPLDLEETVAVLVSSDADFVPAVERVQERGLKVINAGWTGKGHELKAACWGSFDLDTITATICR